MNTHRIMIGLAASLLVFSAGALADEIYKWTDENGVVHYGDRPTGAATEEQLQFSYRRTDPEALQGRVQASNEAEQARQEAREQAAEDRRIAEEEAAEAEERKLQCASYRDRYNRMLASQRIYRTDENGERVYLDEEQRAQSLQRAEEFMKEACSS